MEGSADIDDRSLFIRNIPKSLSEAEKMELFQLFLPKSISLIGNSCARLDFGSSEEATRLLHKLHQMDIMGQKLVVKYANKRNILPVQKSTHRESQKSKEINPFLVKLLALNSQLDFNNPPPPGLKYKYPKASAAIVHRIGNYLRENQSFYTQVLHLMNRMNLPPPFKPQDHFPLTKDTACQTETVQWIRKPDLATDESEMESDEEKELFGKRKRVHVNGSSKRIKAILDKEKELRKNIENRLIKSTEDPNLPDLVFEKRDKITKTEIRIAVPESLPKTSGLNEVREYTSEDISEKPCEEPPLITKKELKDNQIPLDQLKENPIFQNYHSGTPSNVLYLKNLAKNVTVEDLQLIYQHYGRTADSISIDLKTSGRMRGQAFITFSNPYEDVEDSEVPIGERLVDKALKDTNGYILKDKPMYVCYSKSSSATKKS